MKIRIQGNSVRFRLTKSEVERLCEHGSISEQTHFPGQSFTYAVEAKEGIRSLQAHFTQDTIGLQVPLDQLKDWKDSAKVGFYREMPLANAQTLSLKLEKDFTCLEERGEDESDNYPNPKSQLKQL